MLALKDNDNLIISVKEIRKIAGKEYANMTDLEVEIRIKLFAQLANIVYDSKLLESESIKDNEFP